ncbi:hypothetical protein LINPERHAP2_LOCUS45028, partial [Linum perenne]
ESARSEWVILNSDGSVILEIGQAVAGGLICDSQGRCLTMFSTYPWYLICYQG